MHPFNELPVCPQEGRQSQFWFTLVLRHKDVIRPSSRAFRQPSHPVSLNIPEREPAPPKASGHLDRIFVKDYAPIYPLIQRRREDDSEGIDYHQIASSERTFRNLGEMETSRDEEECNQAERKAVHDTSGRCVYPIGARIKHLSNARCSSFFHAEFEFTSKVLAGLSHWTMPEDVNFCEPRLQPSSIADLLDRPCFLLKTETLKHPCNVEVEP
jgi:hypothetical protein